MKRILPHVILLFTFIGYSQITVDETLTTQQLVEDILVNSSCAEVSNFLQSTGTDFGDVNGIAAFDANGSDFPYASGIILTTGDVSNAPGPNLTVHSDGGTGWPGDADLEAVTTATATNNASYIQFDFIPQINQISFDFLFASEEYNQNFECTYSDAFAFILTDQVTGVVQNLAVLPGTSIPIEVTNIRPEVPGQCAAVNEEYFDKYNFEPFNIAADAAIDFNGQIVSLTAMGDVVSGNLYSIKLVVADETDTAFDCAVFLREGSFNLGDVDLGIDLTVATGNARCEGEIYTITPEVTAPTGSTFEWLYEDPLGSGTFVPFVPPETGLNLAVTQTGNYKLIVNFGGTCAAEGTVFVEFAPNITINPVPSSLLVCDADNDGFAEFTLHDADLDITLADPDLFVTYHPTFSDAENNINELFDPYTNDSPFTDVVFARVGTVISSCTEIVTLTLEVRDTPMVLEPSEPLRLCDYNNPGDGLEVFDLTLVEMEVLNGLDPLLYDFYYYELEADAITAGDLALTAPDFSLAIGAPTTYQNVTPLLQVVYILVVGNPSNTSPNNGAQGCYAIVPLTLVVDPLPVAVQALPYELCDDDLNGSTLTDQISTFDLTTREDEITGGDPTLSVSWYETPADELADNPIVNPSAYQNREIPPAPLNPQTIVARVTSAENCNVTTTLTLVVNPNPSPVTPTPLEVCDDDNDGFALFTLEDKDIEIIGGEPGVGVVYYLTQIDAQLGDPAGILVSPYANVVANLQTVWARVENATTGCYSVVGLDLVVNPLPDEPVVPGFGDLTSCDGDGSGSALFNLEDNNVFVYGVQDPLDFSISYHTDQAEAEAGINPVGNPTVFSSTGQTIWVRLENNTTGCYRVSSFELIVGVFPLIATPDDMEACDDLAGGSTTDGIAFFDLTLNDAFITMGDPDLSVFYYETAADQAAGIFIDPATSYENLTNPMTLFVSVFNSTGCWAETTLTLFVNPTPTPVTPTPMEVCDDNNDGFSEFMLTDKDAEIIGGEPDVLISYHETLVDAQNGVFALTSPYANITAYTQVVYARAYFAAPPDGTGCYAVVELELIVNDHPVVPLELPALVLCDDDGFAIFDLTQQDSLIYGTQDPSLYTLTYHISLADAQAGVNPIGTPGAFPNTVTPEQTIYYRLSVNESGCFSTGEFLLQVSIGPMVNQPEPLTLCDDLGEPNDGITSFDLTVKTDEITGGVMGVEVRYYETQQDADDDTNRIDPETAYVNLTNPQTLYVRVIDGNTECYDTSVTLNIRVSPNPTPVTPAPIELCDDNDPGDEIEVFDLTVRESEILNGANWELLYYEVLEDAIEGDPALAIVDPTMYSNTSNPQTIYVRVTIPVSSSSPYGCFEIVELELIVHPIPDDSAIIEPYRICEIGSDGLFIFDLTTKIDEILAGQDPLLFSVSFYHSSADAIAGLNPIINTTTYQNMTNPETIFTGIANIETGCYIGGVQFFDLEVLEGAAATTPAEPYTICDNTEPNDGIADFTLYNLPGDPDPDPMATALANEILGGQPNPPYDLQFYETFELADLGDVTLALPSVYTNVINPQVIYARVTNLDTDCYEIVEVILKVEQLPLVVLDEEYRLCVDINGNPIPEEEGAMSPPVIDTGLDPGLFDIVWQYPGGTAVGPSIIALEEGVYSVTYTEIATGCSGTATTTVVVSQPPRE